LAFNSSRVRAYCGESWWVAPLLSAAARISDARRRGGAVPRLYGGCAVRGPVLAPAAGAADAYPEAASHTIVAHSWSAVVRRPANAVVGRSPHAAVIGSPPHAVVAAPAVVSG
jgi:hypothetical protein